MLEEILSVKMLTTTVLSEAKSSNGVFKCAVMMTVCVCVFVVVMMLCPRCIFQDIPAL